MRRAAFGLAAVLVAAGLAIATWAYFQVPSGARIPIHWDAAGRPNGFGSPASFFIGPGIVLLVVLLLAALPFIEPRRGRALLASPIYVVVLLAVPLFMLGVEIVSVNAGLGGSSQLVSKLVPVGVGALFVVLAPFFPRVGSNFFIGIRTPWTLSSETAWHKTHVLAAWTFGAAGVLLALSVALPARAATWVVLGVLILAAGGPVVYSYFAWRQAPDKARATSTP